jgi:hypothetical protein
MRYISKLMLVIVRLQDHPHSLPRPFGEHQTSVVFFCSSRFLNWKLKASLQKMFKEQQSNCLPSTPGN